jgi:hypothetical protein
MNFTMPMSSASPTPVEAPTFVKRTHVEKLGRDARFVKEYMALARAGGLGPEIQGIVCLSDIRISHRLAATGHRPITRWYDTYDYSTSHRVGAEWHDATFYAQTTFAHHALCLREPTDGAVVHAMTLNLSEKIRRAVLDRGKQGRGWLAKRVAHYLEAKLGRRVDFWLVIEEARAVTPLLHFHGALAIKPTERVLARSALRMAGGELPASKRASQARLDSAIDDGWVSYALKNFRLIYRRYLTRVSKGKLTPLWLDAPAFVSQSLKRDTRRLYKEARAKVRLH